jgi:soluble lytic murein transglycosylase-like protein
LILRSCRRIVWPVFLVCGCATSDIPDYVPLPAEPVISEKESEASAIELTAKKLDEIAPPDSPEGALVADVRSAIRAQIEFAKDDQQKAVALWLQAAKLAEPRFGKIPFEEWVKLLAVSLPQPIDAIQLTKEIFAQTSQGQLIPYMRDRRLNTPMSLMKRLKGIVPDLVSAAESERSESQIKLSQPPSKKGIPATDPLLVATAQRFCRLKVQPDQGWSQWELSLDALTRQYWDAVSFECRGDMPRILAKYSEVVPKLNRALEHGSRSAYAAGRLAALYRAAGERQKAAEAYQLLMEAYEIPSISASDFGDSPREFVLRRVNDTLWAGRYRAMVADGDLAEQYAKLAIEILDKNAGIFVASSNESTTKMSEFRAEAIQILAFRVALEKGEFETSYNLVQNALGSIELNKEWRDRFTWSSGLYLFLKGDFEAARTIWEQMLAENSTQEYRPRLMFWIARCYFKLGFDAEGEFYIKSLGQEYPLSYYTVIAPIAAGLRSTEVLQNLFGRPDELREKFESQREFSTQLWRSDKDVSGLLRRAEILVAAKAGEFALNACRELETVVRKRYAVATNIPRYVYLSRLLYEAGDFHRSIWLTTDLTKESDQLWLQFPDQLIVAYPYPYNAAFSRAAEESQIEAVTMKSVARQESSFRPEVASGAGAIGVMQLMPATASRVNEEAKLGISAIRLTDPETNIRIGSAYLRQLLNRYKDFRPAVYAAYNAGEFVVDIWLEKRRNEDPTLWTELIPFKETNDYVKNVWRNEMVYRYLASKPD